MYWCSLVRKISMHMMICESKNVLLKCIWSKFYNEHLLFNFSMPCFSLLQFERQKKSLKFLFIAYYTVCICCVSCKEWFYVCSCITACSFMFGDGHFLNLNKSNLANLETVFVIVVFFDVMFLSCFHTLKVCQVSFAMMKL